MRFENGNWKCEHGKGAKPCHACSLALTIRLGEARALMQQTATGDWSSNRTYADWVKRRDAFLAATK